MRKQKKTNFKAESGITLIALVITIIVILILAIVTVNMAIDGDGLFGKANSAVEGWGIAVKEEETSLLDLFEKLELIQKTKDEDASTIKQKEDDETVHIIQSIEDLVILANNVNTGTTYEGETFELELSLDFNSRDSYIDPDKENFLELGDINGNGSIESLMVELTTGYGFIPIGDDNENPFKGSIEGNNRTIYGLYINRPEEYYVGLIGVASSVNIKNLSLKDVNISGEYASAFVSYTTGDVICDNLHCTGTIIGVYYAAGLVPYIYRSYSDSYDINIKVSNFTNEAELNATAGYAGAISSFMYYTNIELTNCTNTGKVTASYGGAGLLGYTCSSDTNEKISLKDCTNTGEINGKYYTGGLVGITQNVKKLEINNCKNSGDIKLPSSDSGAGIIGYLSAKELNLTNSCNEGEIINGLGGLIANVASNSMQSFNIDNCYNAGNINNQEQYNGLGGIIGVGSRNNMSINNCYNSGNIYSSADEVGGIVGSCPGTQGTISNCYNTGEINGDDDIAGISGRTSMNIEQCYNTGNINSTGYAAGINIINGAMNTLTVKKCYNRGDIVSSGYYVGGITGGNGSCVIENCYNTGDVQAFRINGGVCGSELTSMKNCYNTGEIKVTGTNTYSLTGGISCKSPYESMTNCYNLGKITVPEGHTSVGSITSYKNDKITDCYYLKGTYPIGIYDEYNPDNSGEKTETEIKQLMVDNLVSLDEWELGEDGLPKLVF